jgi:hypothetical protein
LIKGEELLDRLGDFASEEELCSMEIAEWSS